MLIDSHCHLDYPALAKDREGVLARAKAARVLRMVNIGTTKKGFDEVRATAAAHEEVFCSFGVHPHHVNEEGEYLAEDEIKKLAAYPKIVGIGETGLDYYYNHSPRDMQQESFRRHIRAAMGMDLPIIVHSREAEEDTARILREEGQGTKKPKGVLHCFSSKRILAEESLALGFYISLSGILTFKKSQELRDIARDVPLDRLLVETDSPFLAPEPYRGKVCEPAYVVETARVLAEVKGVNEDEIARHTTENFFRLFDKVSRP
jgi:TatD DNase family protein